MLTNFFDQVFYINLAHRIDRKEQLLSELEKMEVDPSKITRVEAHYDPLHGHRGCAISHLKALDIAIEKGYNFPLILEDDFAFNVSKEELKNSLSDFENLSGHLDVLMLGGDVASYKASSHPNIIQVLRAGLAHGYAVSKHYLPTLRKCFCFAIYKMKDDIFHFEADDNSHTLDNVWKAIQYQAKWYMPRRSIGYQRASFSDTYHTHLERNTPLEYLGERDRSSSS
jgi:glycosyl transferase family 25